MDSKKIILYTSCLMLEIAKADNNVKNEELIIIEEILIDYFRISKKYASEILRASHKELENSIDIFKYANLLNHELDYEDKVDLIRCIFEVGYSDGKLHYLELHYIKIMSSLLNIEKDDVVKAKLEKKN
tara:strand:+ start:2207 stop:2593 length:387 start_codon:yes stop_codon:yes gene_type:complete